jgi:tetratricopeptide (TPR) repeat protein
MVLASGTDYARFAEALKLVGLELDAAGRLKEEKSAAEEGSDGQRARARVLASQGQRQFRQKAIELLEGLAKKRALSPDDQYVLALLYDAEGKADRAREKLQELAQLPTHTPQYLAQYAMTLIARRKEDADLDEAERMIGWLAKLEKDREVGPNEYASVELRARLLEARGKGKEAEKLLRAHAGRARAKPEEVLLVLASLTRQKRYAESFALCERVWKEGKCKPEAIGGVSVALLRVIPDLTDAQAEQVEQHLLSAIEANPKSTVLLMHLSDLYDKRGEFAKAEETYRAVLAKEPNNVVALNNLAWMLATRGGDATEALRHINTAVSGMGRRADLLDTRGLVYLALKQHEKALADLAEAASDAPTPTRLFHLARAQHETRRPHEAIRTLREAKKKGLDLSKIHPIERDECRKLLAEYSLR